MTKRKASEVLKEPHTSRAMVEAMIRMGRVEDDCGVLEQCEAENDGAPTKAERPKKTAEIVQLDFWDDGRSAAPNAVLRAALFPVINRKQSRQFVKSERLAAPRGLEVIFTGERFDQTDLDVYLEILRLALPLPLGQPVKFSAYALLKALGRPTGGTAHQWLHGVLTRLCGGVVDITDQKKRYFGQLIFGGIRDELTLNYEIEINPKFAVLFGVGMWTGIDRAERKALGRNDTAKALHAYYSTHTGRLVHEYETLAQYIDLKDSNPRKVKLKIISAHELLKEIGFLDGYEANAKTIEAFKRHNQSQLKHLAKKTRKPRKNS